MALSLSIFEVGVLVCSKASRADFAAGADAYHGGDFAAALSAWALAAEAGDPLAQSALAMMFDRGQGVDEDPEAAASWYRRAARQGLPSAQVRLAEMLRTGRGVPADPAESAEWLRLAAELGSPEGQRQLGLARARGEGVPRDEVQAYVWLKLASRRSDEEPSEATEERARLRSRLSQTQRAEAARLLKAWRPKSWRDLGAAAYRR